MLWKAHFSALRFQYRKQRNLFFQNLYSNHASLSSVGVERGRYRFSLYAERGCDDMKPTSFETAIRLQFDTPVKRVIDCTVKDYQRELDRRSRREVLFCKFRSLLRPSVLQSFGLKVLQSRTEEEHFV